MKKCVPSQCRRNDSDRPSAIDATGMPDVFELTIASALRTVVDAREQRLLDVEPFDDRFDDPVGAGDPREVRG